MTVHLVELLLACESKLQTRIEKIIMRFETRLDSNWLDKINTLIGIILNLKQSIYKSLASIMVHIYLIIERKEQKQCQDWTRHCGQQIIIKAIHIRHFPLVRDTNIAQKLYKNPSSSYYIFKKQQENYAKKNFIHTLFITYIRN